MTQFPEGSLWDLTGPAAGEWYALVLSEERLGVGSLPEVLVAPVRIGMSIGDITGEDVVCPAAASPNRQILIIAAWALAPIPAHCLRSQLGFVDSACVAKVRERFNRFTGIPVLARRVLRPRTGEPTWHQELRKSMTGYWDGSVAISCATLPTGEEERLAS